MRELLKTDIPFKFNENDLLKRLHCQDKEDEPFQRALELLADVGPQIRSGFAAREFPVDQLNDIGPIIAGTQFISKIAGHKLQGQKTAFIYLATCGRTISRLAEEAEDALDQYLLDQIAYMAYLRAMNLFSHEMEQVFGVERHVRLCPGSVIDWSVSEVKKFFPLMDGLYQALDLRVLDSGLIDPLKSTSGLLYIAEEEFESCAICPRASCENRKAPFDEDLHTQMTNL